eukprot:7869777-Alexandrium_andersonii.AAC.1
MARRVGGGSLVVKKQTRQPTELTRVPRPCQTAGWRAPNPASGNERVGSGSLAAKMRRATVTRKFLGVGRRAAFHPGGMLHALREGAARGAEALAVVRGAGHRGIRRRGLPRGLVRDAPAHGHRAGAAACGAPALGRARPSAGRHPKPGSRRPASRLLRFRFASAAFSSNASAWSILENRNPKGGPCAAPFSKAPARGATIAWSSPRKGPTGQRPSFPPLLEHPFKEAAHWYSWWRFPASPCDEANLGASRLREPARAQSARETREPRFGPWWTYPAGHAARQEVARKARYAPQRLARAERRERLLHEALIDAIEAVKAAQDVARNTLLLAGAGGTCLGDGWCPTFGF